MIKLESERKSRRRIYIPRNREIERMRLLVFRVLRFLWDAFNSEEKVAWFQHPEYFGPPNFDLFMVLLGQMIAIAPELQSFELNEKCRRLERFLGYPHDLLMRVFFVAARADISGDLLKPYLPPPYSHIKRANVEISAPHFGGQPAFVVRGENGEPLLEIEKRRLPDGSCSLLPIVYFASTAYPGDRFSGPETLPEDICRLFNADMLHARRDAPVELDPDLSTAISGSCDSDEIASSWYGGLETWDIVDISTLNGHPLNIACYDRPGDPENTGRRNAVALLKRLRNHDRAVWIKVLENIEWKDNTQTDGTWCGTPGRERRLPIPAFIRECECLGIDCSALDDRRELRAYSIEELMNFPDPGYIIYPVLKPGTYNLIYGASGVAKTWFALHLALSLSQGYSPFPGWEFRGQPQGVLYLAGEMDEEIFGERLSLLLADQVPRGRFRLIRENLDITTEKDQARVKETIAALDARIVFFDNLVTLASNGHTEGKFDKIRELFDFLKNRKISVVLVHHENRDGAFKGTAKIEQIADQSIHLFRAGDGEKIELLVHPEKIRNTSRSEQPAFRTEFDPSHPFAQWPAYKLTPEERRRLDEDDPLDEVGQNIGKKRNNQQRAWVYLDDDERAAAIIDDMLTGCPDDVIAANLAVRMRVIVEFKRQYGITEEALKKHLPDAKKLADRNCGKTTPEVLAPELWKLMRDDAASL